MRFFGPFVPASLGDVNGRGLNKKMCFDGNVRARKISEMLVFESEQERSIPQPSPSLLRDMQKRGGFQSLMSGLQV